MAEASIDQLRITIESKAESAKSQINSLADDVSKLKSTLSSFGSGASTLTSALSKLDSAASSAGNIGKLANEVAKFKGVSVPKSIGTNIGLIAQNSTGFTGASGLNETARAISALSGLKVSASIGNQLPKIRDGVNSLNSVSIDTSKFEKLKDALNGLAQIPKSNISSTINALSKLPTLASKLQSMDMSKFKSQCEQLASALGELPEKMSKVSSGIYAVQKASSSGGFSKISESVSKSSEKTEQFIQKLSNLASTIRTISTLVGVFTQVANAIASCLDASNRYIENMNLANTSLGQYASQAQEFANSVQSALGINSGEFMKNQGTFMTMASGMGVATDNAYAMSKGLTQLSYDLASFFNISNDDAFQKVKSGLAGEIEPLRSLGYDLTNARLQQEAYSMGISESVSSMTQAEKAMLRYKAIMSQVSWAQGDLAKTASSPANQIRILKSQLQTAAQAIGNVFLPMLQAIIPVAVAVIKVIASLANMLAKITGGTEVLTASLGEGGDVTTSLGDTADAADDASSALGDAGDAAGDTGDSAGNAAKQVKELNRQLMGFDEINKFSKQSDSDSGSGSGGTGGNGGNGGSGSGGSPMNVSDIVLDDYDWELGDGFGDELYNEIMDFLNRLYKAFKPLVNDFKVLALAIQHQFDGLDISGAIKNALAGATNLISNAVRNIIEILGPLVVAFNFPETAAWAFDLAAQMCLTLSSAINGVGSMIKGFTDRALIPLVAWIGEKLRGAIKVCIEILQSWQDWFENNLDGLNQLGKAAGTGAGLVLQLATAIADQAFTVFAGVLEGINTVLQIFLSQLVNSKTARAAAEGLGVALGVWAVSGTINNGLKFATTVFTNLAEAIQNGCNKSTPTISGFSGTVGDLKASVDLCKESAGNMATKLSNTSTVTSKLKESFSNLTTKVSGAVAKHFEFKGASEKVADAEKLVKTQTEKAQKAYDELSPKVQKASEKLAEEKSKLDAAKDSLKGNVTASNLYKTAAQGLATAQAGANAKLLAAKQQLAYAKVEMGNYMSSTKVTAAGVLTLAKNEVSAAAGVASSTAVKALATAGTVALSAAQTVLNTVTAAFPGMIMAVALEGIMNVLQPLISTVGDFILGLLGIDTSTGDVTDTTKKANEVLDEEQQQINDNIESLEEYAQSHDNLGDALAMAGFDLDSFAAYLANTGQTVDDVTTKIDDYTSETINSFNKLSTESSASMSDFQETLENNIAVTKQFHDNMQTIMEKTGLDSSSALIQQMLASGPEGCGKAAAEMAGKSKEELQWMVTDNQAIADNATNAVINEYKSAAGEAQSAGAELGNSVESGLESSSPSLQQAAKSEGAATVSSYASGVSGNAMTGQNATKSMAEMATAQLNSSSTTASQKAGSATTSSYASGVSGNSSTAQSAASQTASETASALNTGTDEAKSAGQNLIGGYKDGITAASNSAKTAAKNVMDGAIKALNGGTGYNKAKSAGQNLIGGYKDGIAAASSSAKSAAQSACNNAVSALKSGTSSARSAGTGIMSNFKSGLSSGSSGAASAARSASISAAKALDGGKSAASSAGKSLGNAFKSGLSSVSAASAGKSLAGNAASGMNGYQGSASNSGYYLGIGFANGIYKSAGSVYSAARAVASGAASIMRVVLGIHSPSRVTAEIGKYYDLGFAEGIDKYTSDVSNSVTDMAEEALDTTRTAAEMGAKVGSAYGSAIESSLSVDGVKTALSAVDGMARNYTAPSAGYATAKYTSHEQAATKLDSDGVAEVVSQAVIRSLLTMQPSSQTSGSNDTTIVLRVGDEELARATMRGQASLARRGVLDFG